VKTKTQKYNEYQQTRNNDHSSKFHGGLKGVLNPLLSRTTFAKRLARQQRHYNRCILQWWNDLDSASKTRLCDLNTKLLGHATRWETLTEKEITTLYLSEKNKRNHN